MRSPTHELDELDELEVGACLRSIELPSWQARYKIMRVQRTLRIGVDKYALLISTPVLELEGA